MNYKNWNKRLLDSKGFSIIEAVVAMSILVTVGLSVSYFSSHRYSQIVSKEYKSCILQANTTLDKLRSLGSVKSVATIDPQANRIIRKAGVEHQLQFIQLPDEWLSSTETLLDETPGGQIIVKNYKALVGSMALLNALYSSNPQYCNGSSGFTYDLNSSQELLESGDFEHLRNVSSSLRIQPYNLKTGAVLPCVSPLVVLPSGFNTNTPRAAILGMTGLAPGANPNVGFLVTTFTNYDNAEGINQSCSASAQYSYPDVSVNESTLSDITINVETSSNPPGINNANSFSACETQVPLVRVTVNTNVPDYKTKRAMVMLCRDLSTYTPAGGAAVCYGGPTLTNNFSVDSEWVPCNQLNVCGRFADNSATSQNPQGYVLNYSNVNMGCRIQVEARLMDATQNIATNPSQGSFPAPIRNSCTPCTGMLNRPGTSGWCPGGMRTMFNSCDPMPPPPPPPPRGDGDGDGTPDGGNSDGKGNDGGDKG